MNRAVAVLASTIVVIGCTSTAPPPPDPALVPPEPKVATDPRVSELRIMVLELVDRMEVMQARLNRMEDVLTELADGGQNGPARPVATPDDRAAVQRYVSAADAADTYREAMTLFARGANDDARKSFQAVYDADPRGELADNALYWIGETYFVMNRLREAISYYEKVVENFPSQNKAPDAMHRKAAALVKLGDLSLARTTLQTLIQRYPYSTAASAAKTELERIRY